jgi:uncharacterized coiled-coil DUF342 family protein
MNQPQTPDNEVARLREEVNNWHQHYRDEASKAQKCKQAFIEQEKEVERLKEMVMDAAKRGDEMIAYWKERAEKAEAIIKQLHHYAGIIEGFQASNI